ncbi:hypothetical protein JOS77_27005 [Chromobacterium haemolyticum]|uniref:hypothetical protein n=1 Tax=Chromobacterium haemolyticum TaxID=394935 RepID=UPI000DEF1624|nr:hypothetical protein [Chromobacterium haemolyticum]UGA37578.1 hypothetical protein JOS77_27005 [Chromobacterium haemolyticum]
MIGNIYVNDDVVRAAFERAPQAMARAMEPKVERAGQYLNRAVRQKLRGNRSMGFTTLMNAIHVQRPFAMARDVVAGVRYARFVEDGTAPGYRGLPPIRPLAEWLRIKHGLDAKQARRRAGGLARYFRDHGTKAAPFFKPAYDESQSRLIAILREGAEAGVRAATGVRGHHAFAGSFGGAR